MIPSSSYTCFLICKSSFNAEYGAGGQANISGDVYSFGILILEMLTGKRPVDDMFNDGLTLPKFVVEGAYMEQITDIADPILLTGDANITIDGEISAERNMKECLVALMRLGLQCSNPIPAERKGMKEVATKLHRIKNAYLEGQNS